MSLGMSYSLYTHYSAHTPCTACGLGEPSLLLGLAALDDMCILANSGRA